MSSHRTPKCAVPIAWRSVVKEKMMGGSVATQVIEEQVLAPKTKRAIIDCDVHHYVPLDPRPAALPVARVAAIRGGDRLPGAGASAPTRKGRPARRGSTPFPRPAGRPAPTCRSCASSFWTPGRSSRDPELPLQPLERAERRLRPGARPGRERLDPGGVAGEGAAPARQHRGADQQPGAGGDGDRPARRSSRLRAGAAAGALRRAVRAPPLPPDLRGGGAPRTAGRHPLRRPPRQSRSPPAAGLPTTSRTTPP